VSDKKENYRVEMLATAAISACNEYIATTFNRIPDYEDLHWETKIRIIKVLKANWKLDERIQA
jgi:hypothetical protein